MEVPTDAVLCARQQTGARNVRIRVVAPDVVPDATSPATTSTRQSLLKPPSLDSLAVPTVLVAHIYSFLSLVDHIWLSRTARRLDEVARLPVASPERVVLNQLPPPEFEHRFYPRGLAVVGDDGYVKLDVALLAERFPALEFLSLSNQTELRDLSRLRHLHTLRCRRVHRPVPLPLPERLTAIDYDWYSVEDATQLFRDPSSHQLRSFRTQWMRDSTPQVFPDRQPASLCVAMLRGGAALTDLELSVNLTQCQLDAIARAMGERLTSLGLKRICRDASPHLAETESGDGVVDDRGITIGQRSSPTGGGDDVPAAGEFAALRTLSVSGWHAAVLVSRRAPALRSLAINCDATELGARSALRETRLRQEYWSANNDDGGEPEALSPPDADKRLRHATLTSLKICASLPPPRLDANWTQLRLATRLPSLRGLSITTHTEDAVWSTLTSTLPTSPLPASAPPALFQLDPTIESLNFDARSARDAFALPSSDALTSLVLELSPTLKVTNGFAIPYPSLTHLTLSGFDPAPVLALLGGFARLHTIRLEWITMSLDEIPARLGPILRRLLVTLPNLRRLHLGPHVRANLSELRCVAARLRKVVAAANHPCVVSCDSGLSDGVVFET